MQIKWNKQNPFYFFIDSTTARNQLTSETNPNMYLQITSFHRVLFYLFNSLYLFTIYL